MSFKQIWNALMNGEHTYGDNTLQGILIEDAGKFVWLLIAFGIAMAYMAFEDWRFRRDDRREEAEYQEWLKNWQEAGKA